MTDFADPQLGLRRRHQGRPFQQPEDSDDNMDSNQDDTVDSNTNAESDNAASDRPPTGPQRPTAAPLPPIPPTAATLNRNSINNSNNSPLLDPVSSALTVSSNLRVPWLYGVASTVLVFLAVVVASPPHSSLSSLILLENPTGGIAYGGKSLSIEEITQAAVAGVTTTPKGRENNGEGETGHVRKYEDDVEDSSLSSWMWAQSLQHWWNVPSMEDQFIIDKKGGDDNGSVNNKYKHNNNNQKAWWTRLGKKHSVNLLKAASSKKKDTNKKRSFASMVLEWIPKSVHDFFRDGHHQKYLQWVDPVLLHPTPNTPTDIIDKVLTSTPRLIIIANYMLAMTYLLHSVVASWFLGPQQPQQASSRGNAATNQEQQPLPSGLVIDWSSSSAGARERMGGFLVFKLLLISAVVAPDTLDLLILLTWYTWLSCLRSLDHLAHTTTAHLVALGHPPRSGAVHLLFLVLAFDILAAASCVALFHTAGWGMVLLLTCDCALLGADTMSHILKHLQCVLEDAHTAVVRALEVRQLELHNINNNHANPDRDHQAALNYNDDLDNSFEEDLRHRASDTITPMEVHQESRRLDRRMEGLELSHSQRLAILDSAIFLLDLTCHLLTVAHFCHIWSLHGVQFTLIDGVLALHLHSAVSTACKKITQRRNFHSIARDLQGQFPNATDEELRKASVAGDVCCICLGTMSTGGHVKKVKCGHLYHTHCLREVVERAQSIQAAKCPLCRASLMDGGSRTHPNPRMIRGNLPAAVQLPLGVFTPNPNDPGVGVQRVPQGGGERALFRFSTEAILPVWLPVPAFSFEVVRRPPIVAQGQHQADQALQPVENREQLVIPPTDGPQPQQREQVAETSFLRRLLVFAGAIPMSPEEEAAALAQLVDMFPQYDRSDLLREMRGRGSAEAVTEAILMGVFSGVPRGD